MKRIAIAVCVVVLVFAVVAWAQTPAKQYKFTLAKRVSAEQDLITLENGWNDALVKHDWAFLERIWADDVCITDSDGILSTKSQELAKLKSGEEALTSAVADDFKVRIYGDAAVVTFRTTYKSQSKGKDTSGQERITDTWVKLAGRWQCVASHESRIAQK